MGPGLSYHNGYEAPRRNTVHVWEVPSQPTAEFSFPLRVEFKAFNYAALLKNHSFIFKRMDCQGRNKTYLKKARKSWQWPRGQQILPVTESIS